ncbi:MAG TPA: hypothetical protein VE781_00825, partial [Kineosporiaceae bacterium]|nr:hypothetical protein [Kineosporiaceae bacterium]
HPHVAGAPLCSTNGPDSLGGRSGVGDADRWDGNEGDDDAVETADTVELVDVRLHPRRRSVGEAAAARARHVAAAAPGGSPGTKTATLPPPF